MVERETLRTTKKIKRENQSTSFPRRSFTNETTCAKSKFKATKPLLPRFPNNMSGFTTNLEDESQGSFSCSSVKSVEALILRHKQKQTHQSLFEFKMQHATQATCRMVNDDEFNKHVLPG